MYSKCVRRLRFCFLSFVLLFMISACQPLGIFQDSSPITKDTEYASNTIIVKYGTNFPGYFYSSIIEQEDGTYSLEIAAKTKSTQKEFREKLTEEEVASILSWIDEYKIKRWDGFNKKAKNVEDSLSFDVIVQHDDLHIRAEGYHYLPDNFHEAMEGYIKCLERFVGPIE